MTLRLSTVVGTFPAMTETFVTRFVVDLVEAGLDVHVHCYAIDRDLLAADTHLRRLDDLEERVHLLGHRRTPATMAALARSTARAAMRSPGASVQLHRAAHGRSGIARTLAFSSVVAQRPDIVHFQFLDAALDHLDVITALPWPVTASARGHDVCIAHLERPDAYGPLWPQLAGLHTVSEALWRRARERGCPPDLHHRVITPGVDTAVFEPAPPRAGRLGTVEHPMRVVTVARLHWKKALGDTFSALRSARDRGISVRHRIVGDGPDREAVVHAIHDFDLADVVELVDPMDQRALRAELAQSDVMVLTSVSEGFANAALEAQAVGVPVVCTDAEGLTENVVDGATGFVVARRDPDAVAAKLALLARDPDLRARLGRAGTQRAAAEFAPADRAEAFRDFFEGVVAVGG